MTVKKLALFVYIDLAIIGIVITLFFNIDRRVAGLIGGALFLTQGLYILFTVQKGKDPLTYLTFYAALAHIFLATVPLIILRLSHWSVPFELIEVGFITGPGFHKFSESLYMILIGSHIVDIARLKLLTRPPAG